MATVSSDQCFGKEAYTGSCSLIQHKNRGHGYLEADSLDLELDLDLDLGPYNHLYKSLA